eukprot:RCo034117
MASATQGESSDDNSPPSPSFDAVEEEGDEYDRDEFADADNEEEAEEAAEQTDYASDYSDGSAVEGSVTTPVPASPAKTLASTPSTASRASGRPVVVVKSSSKGSPDECLPPAVALIRRQRTRHSAVLVEVSMHTVVTLSMARQTGEKPGVPSSTSGSTAHVPRSRSGSGDVGDVKHDGAGTACSTGGSAEVLGKGESCKPLPEWMLIPLTDDELLELAEELEEDEKVERSSLRLDEDSAWHTLRNQASDGYEVALKAGPCLPRAGSKDVLVSAMAARVTEVTLDSLAAEQNPHSADAASGASGPEASPESRTENQPSATPAPTAGPVPSGGEIRARSTSLPKEGTCDASPVPSQQVSRKASAVTQGEAKPGKPSPQDASPLPDSSERLPAVQAQRVVRVQEAEVQTEPWPPPCAGCAAASVARVNEATQRSYAAHVAQLYMDKCVVLMNQLHELELKLLDAGRMESLLQAKVTLLEGQLSSAGRAQSPDYYSVLLGLGHGPPASPPKGRHSSPSKCSSSPGRSPGSGFFSREFVRDPTTTLGDASPVSVQSLTAIDYLSGKKSGSCEATPTAVPSRSPAHPCTARQQRRVKVAVAEGSEGTAASPSVVAVVNGESYGSLSALLESHGVPHSAEAGPQSESGLPGASELPRSFGSGRGGATPSAAIHGPAAAGGAGAGTSPGKASVRMQSKLPSRYRVPNWGTKGRVCLEEGAGGDQQGMDPAALEQQRQQAEADARSSANLNAFLAHLWGPCGPPSAWSPHHSRPRRQH